MSTMVFACIRVERGAERHGTVQTATFGPVGESEAGLAGTRLITYRWEDQGQGRNKYGATGFR
jgi:hypothetical protein